MIIDDPAGHGDYADTRRGKGYKNGVSNFMGEENIDLNLMVASSMGFL